jgi:hypothetical protein
MAHNTQSGETPVDGIQTEMRSEVVCEVIGALKNIIDLSSSTSTGVALAFPRF